MVGVVNQGCCRDSGGTIYLVFSSRRFVRRSKDISRNADTWQNLQNDQPLTTATNALAYKVTEPLGWPPRNAVALVYSLAAMVATAILIRFLSRLPKHIALAASVLVIPSALIILYFGYVEATVLALTAQLLYFYLAWEYLQKRIPIWLPALTLGFAIAFHGASVYLLPSFLYYHCYYKM